MLARITLDSDRLLALAVPTEQPEQAGRTLADVRVVGAQVAHPLPARAQKDSQQACGTQMRHAG